MYQHGNLFSDQFMQNMDGNMTPDMAMPSQKRDVPVTLPSFPNTPVGPDGGNFPNTLPSFPDMNEPTTLPSFPDTPVYDPNTPNINFPVTLPSFPDIPVVSPMPPSYPVVPVLRYCNVRFIYAAVGLGPMDVLINDTLVVGGIGYGGISTYTMQPSGSVKITVVESNSPSNIITQGMFTLVQGNVYTFAIINENSGINLYQMTDTSCRKAPYNSCIRAVNLAADTGSIDISMMDGRVLATNLSFKEMGSYKQFAPGLYRVLVYQSGCLGNSTIVPQPRAGHVHIIPIVITTPNGTCRANLILSATLNVAADQQYTLYLIGSMTGVPPIDIVFAKNDFN